VKVHYPLLSVILLPVLSVAQLKFSAVDSVLLYAERNSSTSRITHEQALLARATTNAAAANVINFRNPVSFSATDNLLLPVNFIPADAFGGPAGTYRQITLGQEYVSNFNFNPQVDLINAQNWTKVQSARINEELTSVNNSLTKKNLLEAAAAAYYNSLSLREQQAYFVRSELAFDSLLTVFNNKLKEGLIRSQDVNNATIAALSLKDRLEQVRSSQVQQENAFKVLCNIPLNVQVELSEDNDPGNYNAVQSRNDLTSKAAMLQARLAGAELKAMRRSMLPVVSLAYYQGWQKNSNVSFTDDNAPWIQSKYIGLRITMPIPPDVTRWSQSYSQKISAKIAAINSAQSILQNDAANSNMDLDFKKAAASYVNTLKMFELRSENYRKSLEQFREGILPVDVLLTAFNDLMNTSALLSQSRAVMKMQAARIRINNQMK
jgi:outer membrane protein TolC